MTRRQVREAVIRLVYMSDFRSKEGLSEAFELTLENSGLPEDEEDISSKVKAKDRKEIEEKASAVIEKKQEFDDLIEQKTEGWKPKRIPKVELSIIRVALYEVLFENLDKGIAINEAVEIAKKYGDSNSGAFVNGILARII
ncbi:MAG: transcription antitermination factor NusB [Lachnospiraceae bacterium]|jgi:N utilization substance protein B|nr:transcription antitermination factor NusB [Lachnospiraceae bacterium]MBQ6258537.1 transcription antitermination factor NusB [Lachnospiraceae bacterium]